MTLTTQPAVHVRELSADLDTPVSAYLKLTQGSHGPSFLLESVEGGERQARYSFIGVGERGRLTARGTTVTLSGSFGTGTHDLPDPLAYLYERTRQPAPVPAGLPTFIGGAVGYAAYDLIRVYERLPDANPDELGVPDALFIAPEGLVIFDHLQHRLFAVALSDHPAQAATVTERLVARLRAPLQGPLPGSEPAPIPEFTSNHAPGAFADAVERGLAYIRAGDVFQVVPSQRFSAPLTTHPFALYRALRSVNPSPYLGYLDLGDVTLVASSPESLLRSDGHAITTRPIAGTRPRGATPDEDAALATDLLADEKERAEHLMLVDLGRNDLGRVARYGSVRVHDAFTIERYSHVMHIVSSVTAELRDGLTPLHALASALPMGTVSGAPKIRAMEIIDELEPVRRGPYGGAFGYIAHDGSLDMALTLRTMVIKDGRIHIQAGAGVVADSDPAAEEQETRNKAAALMRAVRLACEGL
ncbi:anthranilate synthase component I [Deinococcus maricopensis]|uniref:Anthranilate synthase component 1 n=1 Tax=Deinococcus maricopensis (strain DSM 21211 / LMG 22137 / NRRL B-23946 / LB-34) TaxID=709986 RepID=E8U9U9_DEIML|nr:anthranilate synthase component I [Deinococcus maricopensis]ADV67838.1 anthranilate synthase component I [Deinococcus maricopensis DSM 21211]